MGCCQTDQTKRYNFKTHRAGTTFKGVIFDITKNGIPADLAGVSAKIEFRKDSETGTVGETLSDGSGLTISGSQVIVDAFTPLLTPGNWFYDLKLTNPDTTVDVYVAGEWRITQNTTDAL